MENKELILEGNLLTYPQQLKECLEGNTTRAYTTCAQIGALMQDIVGYETNTDLPPNQGGMYLIGQLNGTEIYIDPNMKWNDLRIFMDECVLTLKSYDPMGMIV